MQPLKVLLVDDAVVVRRALTDFLSKDDKLSVVGAAKDGREGLKLLSLRPEVIVLDVEMPELDGLGMLKELRARGSKIPVIMFSSVTTRAASATMQALASGAVDYVPKPQAREGTLSEVIPDLIAKIKLHGMAGRRGASRTAPVADKKAVPTLRRPGLKRPDIVVVAASTGGPMALGTLLASLPQQCPVPVVVVQHMPSAVFTEAMAGSLDTLSKLRVVHAAQVMPVTAGAALIAPGGKHLEVARGPTGGAVTKLTTDPPLNGTRPAADALFKSAAKLYGAGVLAVVMTGLGRDGVAGCEAVTAAGGSVIVQDEATSIVWGMPGAVAAAGLASAILPLKELGPEVLRRLGNAAAPARAAGQGRG